jgi:hypothetical protein
MLSPNSGGVVNLAHFPKLFATRHASTPIKGRRCRLPVRNRAAATELTGPFGSPNVTVPQESHLSSYSRSYRMITTKAELNRYFEMIDRRVPVSVSRFIRWLRMPSSFAVRLVIAILLILGGIFSFLPILGIWMLPLGLLLIAQDVPLLQKPLVASFSWGERKCDWLRVKWRNR